MYLASMGLLPGCHRQFMLGIFEMIPLALLMGGLDPFIYLNVYNTVWNTRGDKKEAFIRHVAHLLLSFYLLTVGPYPLRALLKKLSTIFKKRVSPQEEAEKVKMQ